MLGFKCRHENCTVSYAPDKVTLAVRCNNPKCKRTWIGTVHNANKPGWVKEAIKN